MRLSAFIMANTEPILRDWVDFARSLGDVTASMNEAELRDHAALILKAVALDLETPQTPAQEIAKAEGVAPPRSEYLPATAATSHGALRAEAGFSLEQMVSEYRALRASVLRLWTSGHTVFDSGVFNQLMRFNEAIDEALADSIKTYALAVDQMAVRRARYRMEALGTLSAGLGHDMANVLLPMRTCLRVLSEKMEASESTPLLDALGRAVEHLGGLSKGLRALSMDPETSAASPGATDLAAWWASAISPFTWALPPGVRLHARGFETTGVRLPLVRVPAHVLMQAVFNVVQNAAQSLGERNASSRGSDSARSEPTGNIWVTATLGGSIPGDGTRSVNLTVRDDGPGMDAATSARCTEAFFTTKAKNYGSGLGLYLVRSVLERHGGSLKVESEFGKGSTFTLILPAFAEDHEPHPVGVSHAATSSLTPSPGTKVPAKGMQSSAEVKR